MRPPTVAMSVSRPAPTVMSGDAAAVIVGVARIVIEKLWVASANTPLAAVIVPAKVPARSRFRRSARWRGRA